MNINNLLLLLSILTTALTWANEEVEAGENEIDLIAGPVSCEYKSKDLYEEYNVDNDIVIKCSEGSCSINDDNVGAVTSPGFVNITSSGTYIIQGSLEGQVFIDADKDEFVHLVLVDTTISSSNGPAIYGANADKITISIIGNNTLIDTSDYSSLNNEKKPNACLFVDSDLSINGSGSLIVTGNYANAIQSKKDLKLVNASISVPYAVKKGIKAKNSLCVKNANLDVTSTDSALMVTKKDNAEKGYIVIDGGKINISTRNDGIHAETHLTIKDGYIDITRSKEGLEAQMIDILGGEIHILAYDDGINASKISVIDDDDEDEDTEVENGAEGDHNNVYINIVGGKVYITVKGNGCDGIDSNGVLYIGGDAEVYTNIKYGEIYGNVAAIDIDGISSIAPGATVVITTDGGQEELIYDKNDILAQQEAQEAEKEIDRIQEEEINDNNNNNEEVNNEINDGEEINDEEDQIYAKRHYKRQDLTRPNGKIYQPFIYSTFSSQFRETPITIMNDDQEIIASFTPDNDYSIVFITSPKIFTNKSYTIILGTTVQTATAFPADSGSAESPSILSPNDNMQNHILTESQKVTSSELNAPVIISNDTDIEDDKKDTIPGTDIPLPDPDTEGTEDENKDPSIEDENKDPDTEDENKEPEIEGSDDKNKDPDTEGTEDENKDPDTEDENKEPEIEGTDDENKDPDTEGTDDENKNPDTDKDSEIEGTDDENKDPDTEGTEDENKDPDIENGNKDPDTEDENKNSEIEGTDDENKDPNTEGTEDEIPDPDNEVPLSEDEKPSHNIDVEISKTNDEVPLSEGEVPVPVPDDDAPVSGDEEIQNAAEQNEINKENNDGITSDRESDIEADDKESSLLDYVKSFFGEDEDKEKEKEKEKEDDKEKEGDEKKKDDEYDDEKKEVEIEKIDEDADVEEMQKATDIEKGEEKEEEKEMELDEDIEEQEMELGEDEGAINETPVDDEENNINSAEAETVPDETETYQLPKHFHFDIKRKGENTGSEEYKWRRE